MVVLSPRTPSGLPTVRCDARDPARFDDSRLPMPLTWWFCSFAVLFLYYPRIIFACLFFWPACFYDMNPLTAAHTPAAFQKIDKAPFVGQWLHAHISPLVCAGRDLEVALTAVTALLREDARIATPVHFVTRWHAYLDDLQPAYENYVVEHARLR